MDKLKPMSRPRFDPIWQDLSFGTRQLKRTPGFTTVAIISLALGIGTAVTMFSAFRAVFLRALPFRDPEQIVELSKIGAHERGVGTTVADFAFLKKYARSFSELAWSGYFETATLSGGIDPVNLFVRHVSRGLFTLLGSRPLLGRTLGPSDFASGSPGVALISYRAWLKDLNFDSHVIGRHLFLDGRPVTIIGVMPKGFEMPVPGMDAWLPAQEPRGDPLQAWLGSIIGRLRPGVTVEHAGGELRRLLPALAAQYSPSEQNIQWSVENLGTQDAKEYRSAFLLLLAAVALLLLIACLNVANLLLSRASGREEEFAVRTALGAGRKRLIGQVLMESTLLAAASGLCGIGLAIAGNALLRHFLPPDFGVHRLGQTHIDLQVLAVAVAITLLTGIAFGIAPAFVLSQAAVAHSDRHARTIRPGSRRLSAFLACQVGLALLLLSGAILMIRSFVHLLHVDPGFRSSRVLVAGVPPPAGEHLTKDALPRRYRDMLQRVSGVPGVEDAALSTSAPMGHISVEVDLDLPERSRDPFRIPFEAVSADFFKVLRIPLKRGRVFTKADGQRNAPVVVINEAMAQKYWPGRNPIGEKMGKAPHQLTIIGMVGNTKRRGLADTPFPEMYQSFEQYLGPAVGATLLLRTYGNPQSLTASLRQVIHEFDPQQVLDGVQTMDTEVEHSTAEPRFYTVLLLTFGLLALTLTVVGVYGVASYTASRRTREMGIRMALGADRAAVVSMIVRQGLGSVLAGLAAGVLGAWMAARFMASLIYGVPARDPISLSVAAAVLIAGVILAYYLPARRTTRIDPATVLRHE
jgi:putative ABC transport system permease protein